MRLHCDAGDYAIGAPYQVVDGEQKLGDTASASQVLELLSVQRTSAKARGVRKAVTRLCGQEVALDRMYNAMQKQGGFWQVRAGDRHATWVIRCLQ